VEEWTFLGFWDPRDLESSESLFSRRFSATFEELRQTFLATSEQLRRKLTLLRIYLTVIGVETLINRSKISGVIW
jgi:hypothetical protein